MGHTGHKMHLQMSGLQDLYNTLCGTCLKKSPRQFVPNYKFDSFSAQKANSVTAGLPLKIRTKWFRKIISMVVSMFI